MSTFVRIGEFLTIMIIFVDRKWEKIEAQWTLDSFSFTIKNNWKGKGMFGILQILDLEDMNLHFFYKELKGFESKCLIFNLKNDNFIMWLDWFTKEGFFGLFLKMSI